MKVSHKLAERKRRKEMKEIFDELVEALPISTFRGVKASKWEILSRSVEFIALLKQNHDDLVLENGRLRKRLELGPTVFREK